MDYILRASMAVRNNRGRSTRNLNDRSGSNSYGKGSTYNLKTSSNGQHTRKFLSCCGLPLPGVSGSGSSQDKVGSPP